MQFLPAEPYRTRKLRRAAESESLKEEAIGIGNS
jgi:hypothetical protein